jgi:hypothetical protein
MSNFQLFNFKIFDLSVSLKVVEKTQNDLARFLWPSSFVGFPFLSLRATTHRVVKSSEWNASLVSYDSL